ncbi:alpha-N-acetylgalactosaminide alpha-2,6-sialyltransferase 2 [Labeo rohita]|uniref:alpha-N-acetylgalactosaminide alpha-2,6-sialyltransferase n=1 Tax=Labeo rohita TaxID=84645 RepID=A0A498LGQ3_LABRO|nr:alpha-N-acetylgalactosaminide alpha-2,6-sialyltransferase 2 [Labeo rohita]
MTIDAPVILSALFFTIIAIIVASAFLSKKSPQKKEQKQKQPEERSERVTEYHQPRVEQPAPVQKEVIIEKKKDETVPVVEAEVIPVQQTPVQTEVKAEEEVADEPKKEEPVAVAPVIEEVGVVEEQPAVEPEIIPVQETPVQAAPEPEPEPEPVLEPEPVAEAVVASAPVEEPVPVPETVPEQVPASSPEPVSATVEEPVPEPVEESVPEPVKESVPEPVKESVPEPVKESVPEPVKESVPEPVKESVPEPVKESVPEPEPVPEPVPEVPIHEPASEPTPEPVSVSTPETTSPPTPEPVSVPIPEPEPTPIAEPPSAPTPEESPETSPAAESLPEAFPETLENNDVAAALLTDEVETLDVVPGNKRAAKFEKLMTKEEMEEEQSSVLHSPPPPHPSTHCGYLDKEVDEARTGEDKATPVDNVCLVTNGEQNTTQFQLVTPSEVPSSCVPDKTAALDKLITEASVPLSDGGVTAMPGDSPQSTAPQSPEPKSSGSNMSTLKCGEKRPRESDEHSVASVKRRLRPSEDCEEECVPDYDERCAELWIDGEMAACEAYELLKSRRNTQPPHAVRQHVNNVSVRQPPTQNDIAHIARAEVLASFQSLTNLIRLSIEWRRADYIEVINGLRGLNRNVTGVANELRSMRTEQRQVLDAISLMNEKMNVIQRDAFEAEVSWIVNDTAEEKAVPACSLRHIIKKEDSLKKQFSFLVPVLQWRDSFISSHWEKLQNEPLPYGWKDQPFHEIGKTLYLLSHPGNSHLFERKTADTCVCCAVVGNGGILNGSRQGKAIDSHDYVFRVNGAVIRGFEDDVGTRTSFYGFTTNSLKNSLIAYYQEGFHKVPRDPGIGYIFIPSQTRDYVMLAAAIQGVSVPSGPDEGDRFLKSPQLEQYRDLYMPSTGALMLLAALHTCDQVSAYGFITENYEDFSDHYYDKEIKPLVFYANHDMEMEGRLWKQLHSQNVLRLYQRQKRT